MKAILEFDMDDPTHKEEHGVMLKAYDLTFAISDFDNELRAKLKYSDTISDQEHEILTNVRKRLWEILNERDVASVI